MDNNFEDSADELEYKSKTQLKNESSALQKLGEKLVSLSPQVLAKLPLDDELTDAIKLAQRINKRQEGWRRQLQFIGKLMRSRDVEPIELELAKMEGAHQQANQHFHKLEQWRDRLLQKGDSEVNMLLEEHAHLDRQKLRTLIRQANKQQKENKPPKAAREIFQYLKENLPQQ
ncbi:ribosome biogenesis factor YjgA [Neptunicella marina]|uniref:Dual-action ribosomal maturation protein DarP n=1 Tax=Neptunicella marina TaxID=2125989 RepID=A0A8J6ISV0_9ALTE|nr:ribosome biogenesis factor YjgA [Neptunicella marina]MBC3766126.1 ribosome-associated protein [Neptunicella marina]